MIIGGFFAPDGNTSYWLLAPSDTIWLGLGPDGMVTEVQWQSGSAFESSHHPVDQA
jgi:hypothetical protein